MKYQQNKVIKICNKIENEMQNSLWGFFLFLFFIVPIHFSKQQTVPSLQGIWLFFNIILRLQVADVRKWFAADAGVICHEKINVAGNSGEEKWKNFFFVGAGTF